MDVVPHVFPDRPELTPFPPGIVFVRERRSGLERIVERASYEADPRSFSQKGTVFRLTYRNVPGGSGRSVLRYDHLTDRYFGEKFVDGASVGLVTWAKRKPFFADFAALGVSDGERYESRRVGCA
jgi:hypothetical protein